MMVWLEAACAAAAAGEASALITLLDVKGSAPREAGTKMLVTPAGQAGTIGGGQLEYQAVARARSLLSGPPASPLMETVPLGPELGQCCGGSVRLLIEPLAPDADWLQSLAEAIRQGNDVFLIGDLSRPQSDKQVLRMDAPWSTLPAAVADRLRAFGAASETLALMDEEAVFIERFSAGGQPLWLFGAGHVGRALVHALSPLPFAVTWVDSRPDAFPSQLPDGTNSDVCDPPWFAVERAPARAFYLVTTHSHAYDLAVCEAVLRRGDAGYLGLIGSDTKRTRFLRRLEAKGVGAESLARLTCPIGLPGIKDKEPGVIAASVAADLLLRRAAIKQADGLVA